VIIPGKELAGIGEVLLIRKNVNPDPKWCGGGRMPFLLAAEKGCWDVVRVLLGKEDFNLTCKTCEAQDQYLTL